MDYPGPSIFLFEIGLYCHSLYFLITTSINVLNISPQSLIDDIVCYLLSLVPMVNIYSLSKPDLLYVIILECEVIKPWQLSPHFSEEDRFIVFLLDD